VRHARIPADTNLSTGHARPLLTVWKTTLKANGPKLQNGPITCDAVGAQLNFAVGALMRVQACQAIKAFVTASSSPSLLFATRALNAHMNARIGCAALTHCLSTFSAEFQSPSFVLAQLTARDAIEALVMCICGCHLRSLAYGTNKWIITDAASRTKGSAFAKHTAQRDALR